jgi:hypothetical protein
LVPWPAQLTHAAPFDPQALAAVPPTHDPPEQHPAWHGWLALQELVQVVPLQACPKGQSVVLEQRLVQTPPVQVCVTPQTCPPPQPPQLLGSEVKSTQAPAHAENPELQAYKQELALQVGVALVTAVVHAWPHDPQLVTSLAVLVHPPPQRDGVDGGQPEEQPYVPPSPGAQ